MYSMLGINQRNNWKILCVPNKNVLKEYKFNEGRNVLLANISSIVRRVPGI